MKRVLALAMIALLAVPASAAVGSPDALLADESTDPGSEASAVAAQSGSTSNDSNVTRTQLEIPGDGRHNATRLSLDLGTSMKLDDEAIESRYQLEVDRQRIAGVGTADPLVDRLTDRIASRIGTLRAREQAATRAYATNEISDREFARRLVLISREATRLDNQLSSLKSAADERETVLRLESLSLRLQSRFGPAHETLERGLRGSPTTDVSVAATPQGYVLGLIDRSQGTYRRHAVHLDARGAPSGTVTIDTPTDGFDRVRALYPETNTNEVFISSARYANDARLIQLNVNYPEGPVLLYVDTVSGDVFFEERRFELETMPRSTAANETFDGVRIVVERTFDNGPTLVKAFDADTGEPIGVTLTVDGRDVGGTGVNGERWFIAPPGTYQLSVSSGDARFNVTVPAA